MEFHAQILKKLKCFKNSLSDLKTDENNNIYYDIIYKTIIERKAEQDLEASISDKRLFEQCTKLKHLEVLYNLKNLLLVEKTQKNMSALQDNKKLSDIQLNLQLSTVITDSTAESVALMNRM